MSIREKLKSLAKGSVDLFPTLSAAEKAENRLMGTICAQIIHRRKALGMTQTELAAKLDVKQPMVSQWENGECNFTVSTLAEIFTALNLHIDLVFKPFDYESLSSADQYAIGQKSTGSLTFDNGSLEAAA